MNPHQILGLSPGVSLDDIKAAYRRLALLHHPDRGGDPARFRQLTAAYQILSQPDTAASEDPDYRGTDFGLSPDIWASFSRKVQEIIKNAAPDLDLAAGQ